MSSPSNDPEWSLIVVRGEATGRAFPLAPGDVLLGNGLDGEPGIDLSPIEGNAARRMAAKQARLRVNNGSVSLRDLDSPGGTFVDRRRVPPGSDLPLREGDVIQLAGVQLRLSRGGATAVEPSQSTNHGLGALRSGVQLGRWDDVLTVSAQKWKELVDDLTSGRIAAELVRMGRPDLAPDPSAPGSPDERLDTWLGRLAVTRPAKPELDVHPRTLVLKAPPGGGSVRKKLTIQNVGYRLLHATASVAPEGKTWLELPGGRDGKPFTTVDATDLAIEAQVPETLPAPLVGTITIRTDGGDAVVTVRVEPAGIAQNVPEASASTRRTGVWRETLASQSAKFRLVAWSVAAISARLLLGLGDKLFPTTGSSPGLLGPVLLFALAGTLLAPFLARQRSEARDLPTLATGGAILGCMLSAVVVALCRTVESPLGSWASGPAAAALWGLVLAGLAALSVVLIPPKPTGSDQ